MAPNISGYDHCQGFEPPAALLTENNPLNAGGRASIDWSRRQTWAAIQASSRVKMPLQFTACVALSSRHVRASLAPSLPSGGDGGMGAALRGAHSLQSIGR